MRKLREAARRRPKQSGPPLPAVEARPQPERSAGVLKRAAVPLCVMALLAAALGAQSLDVAAGVGGVAGAARISGGLWPGGSVTFMPFSHLGVNAEFAGRTSTKLFFGVPYRPALLDFNAVIRPVAGLPWTPELLVGGGTEFLLHPQLGCIPELVPCPQPPSRERMAHVGGDVVIHFGRHIFIRPEVHFYLTHDLDTPWRFALSIGYTVGRP